jgi:hypothetical protein
MAGRPQKLPGDLVDRRPSRQRGVVLVSQPAAPVAPPPPGEVGAYARAVWEAYFRSPVSATVTMEAHGERLVYWIKCVDQRVRLWELWAKQPLIKGSQGQPMTNPLWRTLRELTETIERAEHEFGMTPLAQLRLGVTFLHEQNLANSLKKSRVGRRPTCRMVPVP